jgi:hypothetical protein
MPALGISDIAGVNWNQIGTGDTRLRQTLDEWGCTWSRSTEKNMGQVTGHPLADWSALEHFHFLIRITQISTRDGKTFFGTEGKFICTNLHAAL